MTRKRKVAVEQPPAVLSDAEAEALEKFKSFCLTQIPVDEDDPRRTDDEGLIDGSGEQDWFSLSLGFFAALGLHPSACHTLAIRARYTHHYWWP